MGDIGHNSQLSPEDKARLAKLHREIGEFKDAARAANANANARRKEIRAMGVDLQAYAASAARAQMDVDQRLAFDQSVANCNEALGIPVQGDLFSEGDADDGNPIPSGATH